MKTSRHIIALALALTVVLVRPVVPHAGEIRVWTARAIATVLAEIGSEFERETGHTLIVSSDLWAGVRAKTRADLMGALAKRQR